MKNHMFNKHLLLLSLGCLMLLTMQQAKAQVDKAMKYAWYFDYDRAEKYLLNDQNNLNPDMVVQLAEALYAQGKYAQALYYYKIADQKGAIQNAQVRRNYVHSSTMMREKSPYFKKTAYFKHNYFLYTNIDTFAGNSVNEDFAAFPWNNLLFVTTSRSTINNQKAFDYTLTKMPFLDVYPFNESGKSIPYPAYLPKTINTSVHDGPITISKDTNLIVLTRNYAKANAGGIQNLYLVYYMRDAKGRWGASKMVEFCKPSFSAQHPYYNEKEQALYFSSDMPGGKGGYDLYKTKWNGTAWSNPINLGDEINSEYDEVFPGFTPEGELIYSTNHIESTGGLDIVVYSNGNRYLLNEPFNTIYDDFGLGYKNAKEGFFSSNRFSSKFDDNIYHFKLSEPEKQSLFVKVYDVETGTELDNARVSYSNPSGTYTGEVVTRAGRDNVVVRDTADARKPMNFYVMKDGYLSKGESNNEFVIKEGKLIKEVYIQINPVFAADDQYTIEDNQRNSKLPSLLANDQLLGNPLKNGDVNLSIFNNSLAAFMTIDPTDGSMKVSSGVNPGTYTLQYAICNAKAPAQCDTANITLVVKGIYAYQPMSSMAGPMGGSTGVGTAVAPVKEGLFVVDDIGYATVNGGYVLNVRNNDRLNGKKANMKNTVISNSKSDNPNVTLNSKTGAVEVKKGTAAGTYMLSYDLHKRGNKDQMGSAMVKIVVRTFDQIPGRGVKGGGTAQSDNSVVYFNNDEPKQYQLYRPAYNYQTAFENYMKDRKIFYQRSIDSKGSLDTFFTYHVEGGLREMNRVMEVIQQKLDQGVQVEVSVSAYCSPIASEEYNNKLSTRRIVAVTRYFKKWNDGALNDAIESNRITFWEHAVGELEAPKDVNADYDKENESVFGIKASRERRVSITIKILAVN